MTETALRLMAEVLAAVPPELAPAFEDGMRRLYREGFRVGERREREACAVLVENSSLAPGRDDSRRRVAAEIRARADDAVPEERATRGIGGGRKRARHSDACASVGTRKKCDCGAVS